MRRRRSTLPTGPLLRWYRRAARPLPWRLDPTPYRVWVGEVMSQQTTLAVAVPRFESFVRGLPDVEALASASDASLARLWAGLGYYARVRNLRSGARHVTGRLGGAFPETYEGWLAVPGCGPCTAAMVASMCYGARAAAVDGNVIRVSSRLLALGDATWTPRGRSRIRALVEDAVSRTSSPGDLNQALMELGQELCLRSGATCARCPIASACLARRRGIVDGCPPPRPRRRPEDVAITAVVLESGGRLLVGRRSRGLLSGTVGFPILEGRVRRPAWLRAGGSRLIEPGFGHAITHRRLRVSVLVVASAGPRPRSTELPDELHVDGPSWAGASEVEGLLASSLDLKVLALVRARRSG